MTIMLEALVRSSVMGTTWVGDRRMTRSGTEIRANPKPVSPEAMLAMKTTAALMRWGPENSEFMVPWFCSFHMAGIRRSTRYIS
jgi:hypothetical protein